MKKKQRVTITLNPVASVYQLPTERIIKFSLPTGKSSGPNGGLISFYVRDDGEISINVYRYSPNISFVLGLDEQGNAPKVYVGGKLVTKEADSE